MLGLSLLGIISAAGLGCKDWPAAKAFCNGSPSKFEPGIGYPHATTTAGPTTTSEVECCCACAGDVQCNGWTLNAKDKHCYLKQNAGPATAVKNNNTVSGLMPPRPPPPPYKPLYPTPSGAKNVLFLAVREKLPTSLLMCFANLFSKHLIYVGIYPLLPRLMTCGHLLERTTSLSQGTHRTHLTSTSLQPKAHFSPMPMSSTPSAGPLACFHQKEACMC
jgi:hypothetical protein